MPGLVEDTPEHKEIRQSVSGIVSRYGSDYFLERGRSGAGIDELWKDLGAAGLLGVHLPEEDGGGGGGRGGTGGARDADADLGDLAGNLRQHPRAPRLGTDEA